MRKEENSTIVLSFGNDKYTGRSRRAGELLAYILISAAYAAAFTGSICALTETDAGWTMITAAAAVSAVLLNIIWCFSGRKRIIAGCGYIAVILAVTAVKIFYVRNGVAIIADGAIRQAGILERRIYMDIAVTCTDSQNGMCIAWAVMMITAAAAFMTVFIVRDGNRIAAGLLFILTAAANIICGSTESALWLTVAGACTLAVFAAGTTAGGQLTAARSRNTVLLYAVLFIAVMSVAGTLVFRQTGYMDKYSRTDTAAGAALSVSERIYKARYGDDTLRSMPNGDFSDLGNLQFSGQPMLEIESDKFGSLYLRGFTGCDYNGSGWDETDGRTLYSNADDFYWLHDAGLFGQNQLSYAARNIDKKVSEDTLTMKIKNVGADRRYYYTPYELTSLVTEGKDSKSVSVMDDSVLDDGSFTAYGYSGEHSYTVTSLKNQVKRYPTLVMMLSKQLDKGQLTSYEAQESRYNSWIYDTYTGIPEDTRRLLENHTGKKLDRPAGEKHAAYKQVKEKILNCLNKELEYDTDVAERGEDTDFLQDLFEISRSGYSVHYATAATLMFRYYGIPARYVEGYLITPDAARKADKTGKLTITDNDAHAWVEYYQDGIGWIPFEVTPPYMDVMEQPQQLSSSGGSGSSGSRGSAGQSLEMEKDNYEPKEPEKKKDDSGIPLMKIVIPAAGILILLLAALLVWHLIRRRCRLKSLNASFSDEDLRRAVTELFAYVMGLQEAAGIEIRNCSLYDYRDDVAALAGKDAGERYRKTVNIYQKAVYSQLDISPEDRNYVAGYKDEMLSLLKKQSSLLKRLKLRWIKGLY